METDLHYLTLPCECSHRKVCFFRAEAQVLFRKMRFKDEKKGWKKITDMLNEHCQYKQPLPERVE